MGPVGTATSYVVTANGSGVGLINQTAMCTAGDIATGGGVSMNQSLLPTAVVSTMPVTDGGTPVGWSGSAYGPFTVYAVCQHTQPAG